jgi:O-antigen ligase
MTLAARRLTFARVARFLWAAILVSMPVTSFRYFPGGDGTYVRPLAFYPLLLLLPVLAILWARGGSSFPRVGALIPLVAFLLAALVASASGLLLGPVPLRGQQVLGRIVRAWATIGAGFAFFGVAAWMNRDQADLEFTLKWLLAGFVLDILWSGLQAATFYLQALPKPLVTHWQRAFSMRELIRTNRISGMAYEPSWLAGQIATVYAPWLVAGLLVPWRATRQRRFELLLLIAAVLLLLATYSRGGLLMAVVASIVTLMVAGRNQVRSAWAWYWRGWGRARDAAMRIALAALGVVALLGAVLFLAQKGYIARLWNTQASSLSDFIIQNSAGARTAYLAGAMKAYAVQPFLGVGPGASGFYIYSGLPDWALTTVPEIARQLNPESALYPNPKNLYVRLLAETGLTGFALFGAYLLHLLGDTLVAARSQSTIWRYLGTAAIFAWVAILVYNATQDSFATPNMWINFGILAGITASGRVGSA